MDVVRVAVLGACGWMGKTHTLGYQNLPFLFGDSRGRAEVRWIVDGDEAKLKETAREIPGVRTSSRWQDVIADPDVDLVDICLPDSLHLAV